MTAALALQIIAALLTDFPELIKDAKDLVSEIEAGHAAPAEPITPTIESEDAPLLNRLPKSQ